MVAEDTLIIKCGWPKYASEHTNSFIGIEDLEKIRGLTVITFNNNFIGAFGIVRRKPRTRIEDD
jgi:hypothetical protein